MLLKYYYIIISFLVISLLLSGCWLKFDRIQPEYKELSKTTVQYATLRYIEGDIDKANTVYEMTQYVTDLADNGLVSLDTLESELLNHVPWDRFTLENQFLIENLIGHVVTQLKQIEVDIDIDKDEIEYYILEVVNWIEQSALMLREY